METAELTDIKSVIPYFIKHKSIWSSYDEEADVLYLHFTKPNNSDHSEMTDDEIIVRYEKSSVVGMTILNASQRLKNMD